MVVYVKVAVLVVEVVAALGVVVVVVLTAVMSVFVYSRCLTNVLAIRVDLRYFLSGDRSRD